MLKLLANRLRAAWRVDLEQSIRPLRKDVRLLSEEVTRLRAALEAHSGVGGRSMTQMKMILQINDEQKDLIATLPNLLDEPRILAHVRHAIANAKVHSDPLDYIVVERLLPDDVY